ncbi:hypothetical protein TKK_0007322 [Trichogramma kaykai]
MPNQADYSFAIGPCRTGLRIFGAWPDPIIPRTQLDILRSIIVSLTILIFGFIPQLSMAIIVANVRDWNGVIEILTTATVPFVVSLTKFNVSCYQRNVLKTLTTMMKDDWNDFHLGADFKFMQENAALGRKISQICLFLALSVVIPHCLLMAVIYFVNWGEYVDLCLISYFPFETNRRPNYEIILVGQCFSLIFGASTHAIIDGFFSTLHEKSFFEMLPKIIDRFVSLIDDSFNLMFLAQIMATATSLCFQGYQLVMVTSASENGISVLELTQLAFFIGSYSSSLFVYCYVVEKLNYESYQLVNTIFSSGWYDLPSSVIKNLMLLMCRAQKPLEVTAGKFCYFSLEFYCRILNSTGGYISMLLAVRDRLAEENQ